MMTRRTGPAALTQEIQLYLRDLIAGLHQLNDAVGARVELRGPDLEILDLVARHGPLSPSEVAASTGVPKDGFEFDLLYGIQRDEQQQLARDNFRIRVLISYGEFWFPWYMRRLAERPANVWFVVKSTFSS